MKRMATVLILAVAMAGCRGGDEPLLPAPQGSVVLSRGIPARLGPVEIGVKAAAGDKASMSILVLEPEKVGPEDAVLSIGQSIRVGGATVTLVAVDESRERPRVRVLVEPPDRPPTSAPVESGSPPTPPPP